MYIFLILVRCTTKLPSLVAFGQILQQITGVGKFTYPPPSQRTCQTSPRIGLKTLEAYCKENEITINTKKTKCMIFNKGGRLMRRSFYLDGVQLENVRSYKYLGFLITPSGEINTGLKDLRDGLQSFHENQK